QRPLHRRQRRVQCGLDQRALPSDGVAGHISQTGAAEGPGGLQEPGALPVRRLWFRLRRAGKYGCYGAGCELPRTAGFRQS
ncbi:MAG: hypothetical protein ACP5MD_09245, partial [Verrucomicrobiia bacterium]